MSVSPSSVLIITGPAGAGKSTLAAAVARLLQQHHDAAAAAAASASAASGPSASVVHLEADQFWHCFVQPAKPPHLLQQQRQQQQQQQPASSSSSGSSSSSESEEVDETRASRRIQFKRLMLSSMASALTFAMMEEGDAQQPAPAHQHTLVDFTYHPRFCMNVAKTMAAKRRVQLHMCVLRPASVDVCVRRVRARERAATAAAAARGDEPCHAMSETAIRGLFALFTDAECDAAKLPRSHIVDNTGALEAAAAAEEATTAAAEASGREEAAAVAQRVLDLFLAGKLVI